MTPLAPSPAYRETTIRPCRPQQSLEASRSSTWNLASLLQSLLLHSSSRTKSRRSPENSARIDLENHSPAYCCCSKSCQAESKHPSRHPPPHTHSSLRNPCCQTSFCVSCHSSK